MNRGIEAPQGPHLGEAPMQHLSQAPGVLDLPVDGFRCHLPQLVLGFAGLRRQNRFMRCRLVRPFGMRPRGAFWSRHSLCVILPGATSAVAPVPSMASRFSSL